MALRSAARRELCTWAVRKDCARHDDFFIGMWHHLSLLEAEAKVTGKATILLLIIGRLLK